MESPCDDGKLPSPAKLKKRGIKLAGKQYQLLPDMLFSIMIVS